MLSTAHRLSDPVPAGIGPEELRRLIAPEGWLGYATAPHFAGLARSAPAVAPGEASRFFASRGLRGPRSDLRERSLARALIALDVSAIAHALSLLLSGSVEKTALELLPGAVRTALKEDPPELDHVGIEVFGRLEWYLETLSAWAQRGPVRLAGYRIFPSVQVRKALAYDPDLRDVRIARVYVESDAGDLNLELFEVAQHWLYTVSRQATLLADVPRADCDRIVRSLVGQVPLPLEPLGHLALRVGRWQTVDAVHRLLSNPRSQHEGTKLYDDGLCYNHGDQSLNSKLLTRSATLCGESVFGRIIELISTGVRVDPRGHDGNSSAGGT